MWFTKVKYKSTTPGIATHALSMTRAQREQVPVDRKEEEEVREALSLG